MKTIACIIAALVVASPLTSFAQSNAQPLTRAQVRHELVQLEQVGYRPAAKDPHYPAQIQAAEAKVQAMGGSQASYGGSVDGTASSRPMAQGGVEAYSIYYGH